MKHRDDDRASVPQRRRHPVLEGEGYSDQEMRSRIKGFPECEAIWSGSEKPTLVNPETPVHLTRADRQAAPETRRVGLLINRQGDKVCAPGGIEALEAVLQVRRYRLRHILYKSGLHNNDGVKKVVNRSCYDLTKHKQTIAKQHIFEYFGYSVDCFRSASYSYFEHTFGKQIKAMATSQRKMKHAIPSTNLLDFLKREQATIVALHDAVQDAQHVWGAVAAVFERSLMESTPTLNSLYRIFRPEHTVMLNENEFKGALVLISFFGCTDATEIYLEYTPFSAVCRVASFLGRANLGLPEPTWKEAGAYLHLVCGLIDTDRELPRIAEAEALLEALKKVPDWDRYHPFLQEVCHQKFYEGVPGTPQVRPNVQLWRMI